MKNSCVVGLKLPAELGYPITITVKLAFLFDCFPSPSAQLEEREYEEARQLLEQTRGARKGGVGAKPGVPLKEGEKMDKQVCACGCCALLLLGLDCAVTVVWTQRARLWREHRKRCTSVVTLHASTINASSVALPTVILTVHTTLNTQQKPSLLHLPDRLHPPHPTPGHGEGGAFRAAQGAAGDGAQAGQDRQAA